MSGNRSKSAFFEGVGHFECRFQREGGIAYHCGMKISAVLHLVLSPQYTRLTDRRTDRRTEFRQQYRALHYMQSHGKSRLLSAFVKHLL